jgi:hypothetical protein
MAFRLVFRSGVVDPSIEAIHQSPTTFQASEEKEPSMTRAGKAVTFAKRERERSTRKQAATMSVVTVATDHVGVSASDRPPGLLHHVPSPAPS